MNLKYIDGMNGHEFENFCAELLQKNGFLDVSVTPGSGDQGVDVLATKDGIKYAIQCKNYASPLSNTPVQEVSAGKQFYGCHVGVVLTNSTFTPGAVQLADATNVLLWDRFRLKELIVSAGGLEALGVSFDCAFGEPEEIDDDLVYQEELANKIIGLLEDYYDILGNGLDGSFGEFNECTGGQGILLIHGMNRLAKALLKNGYDAREKMKTIRNTLSELYKSLNESDNTWCACDDSILEILKASEANNDFIQPMTEFTNTVGRMKLPSDIFFIGQDANDFRNAKKELKSAASECIRCLNESNAVLREINREYKKYKKEEKARKKQS